MITQHTHGSRERGIVLIAALLLLVIMSILAMTMFRTNGVQELIAGNVREKQRALQTAMDAETYAEMVLSNMGNIMQYQDPNSTMYKYCTNVGLVAYTATSLPTFCYNSLSTLGVTSPTTVPWINTNTGTEVGYTFYPGNVATSTDDMSIATTPGLNTYLQPPRFYIAYLGQVQNRAYYQVDAWNWASTNNTAAEVEGMYVVTCNSACVAPSL
jgi:type IV pilus assembly protein PilX